MVHQGSEVFISVVDGSILSLSAIYKERPSFRIAENGHFYVV